MKKMLFSVFILLTLIFPCIADDRNSLSGIWELNKDTRLINKGVFSWGENAYSMSSLIIDFGSTPKQLSLHTGVFIITRIDNYDNKKMLYGHFYDQKETYYMLTIHIVDSDTIWLSDPSDYSWDLASGQQHQYHRIPINAPYNPLKDDEDI